MDRLNELSAHFGGEIRVQDLYNWNYDQNSFRELIIKNYKGYKIGISEFDNLFEIEFDLGSAFAFSINLPNKIFNYNIPATVRGFLYNLYFSNDEDENHPLSKGAFPKSWDYFVAEVGDLKLFKNEGIFLYGNAIQFTLQSERDLTCDVDKIVDLISKSGDIFYKEINERIFAKNLPQTLRHLIPLLKKWSVADDGWRDQLIEDASEKQKINLIKAVSPYLFEINGFLDSFNDEPLTHEAILMGNLAELVSDLMIN